MYKQIGLQAEQGRTSAVRVWMRKLPGQLLRIAIALHVIECYHQPGRPKHEIQVDTLRRAVEFAKYYRSAFQTVQECVADSDDVSGILIKIWDMAAVSSEGVAVRDAYRNIKAIQRRAKEVGRSVAAYTQDLYQQLAEMGRGVVQRCGRLIRFVAGSVDTPVALEVTKPKTQEQQEFSVSSEDIQSPVTNEATDQFTPINFSSALSEDPVLSDISVVCNETEDDERIATNPSRPTPYLVRNEGTRLKNARIQSPD